MPKFSKASLDLPSTLDLRDADDTEVKLVDYAHQLSMSKDKDEAAVGRVMKAMVPGFCAAIRAENARSSVCATLVNGLLNTVALFLGMVVVAGAMPGRRQSALDEVVNGIKMGAQHFIEGTSDGFGDTDADVDSFLSFMSKASLTKEESDAK